MPFAFDIMIFWHRIASARRCFKRSWNFNIARLWAQSNAGNIKRGWRSKTSLRAISFFVSLRSPSQRQDANLNRPSQRCPPLLPHRQPELRLPRPSFRRRARPLLTRFLQYCLLLQIGIRPSLSSASGCRARDRAVLKAPLAVDISEVSGDQGIEICVEGSKDYVAGEQVDLQLYVQSRQGRMRLENVQVVIKLIGTTFSPRLYAGKTDRFGCLRMNFSLPTFSGGSAALIIQVSTSIGNDEVKYLVRRRR